MALVQTNMHPEKITSKKIIIPQYSFHTSSTNNSCSFSGLGNMTSKHHHHHHGIHRHHSHFQSAVPHFHPHNRQHQKRAAAACWLNNGINVRCNEECNFAGQEQQEGITCYEEEERITDGELLELEQLRRPNGTTNRVSDRFSPDLITMGENSKQIYKLVLTGGPCGGKTTGQESLASFFEGYGWKVFTVPETASVLLNGRIRFSELNEEQAYKFQKDLFRTLMQIEQVFFNQAKLIHDRNVLIICDRGALDPSAYMSVTDWERLLKECGLDHFELRDNRYNQIVHMVTAADGAEQYYTCANNTARSESLEAALEQDKRTREAWVGHQCLSIVDNSNCRSFKEKIAKLISVVCERLGVPYKERWAPNSKKRKWLVARVSDEAAFATIKFEEFRVKHDYLLSPNSNNQVRLRSRTQNGRTTYTLTTRRFESANGERLPEPVETRKQLSRREYHEYLQLRDRSRHSVHKRRRCFLYGNVCFNLDIYVEPLPPAIGRVHPLMILETYTTHPVGDSEPQLPEFLEVEREITQSPAFSMFNLAENGTGKKESVHNGV